MQITGSNQSHEESNVRYIEAEEKHDVNFKVAFFFGLIFGSVLGGLASFQFQPATCSRIFCLVNILTGLIITQLNADTNPVLDAVLWFCISSTMIAHFLTEFIFMMDNIDKSWRLVTALLGIGLAWTVARIEALLLSIYVEDFDTKIFVTTYLIIVASSLREFFRPYIFNECQDEEKEDDGRTLRGEIIRCAIFSFIWFIHGYSYYGLAHSWYGMTSVQAHFSYVRLSDAVAKILTLFLVQWTKQIGVVFGVVSFITGILCLVTFVAAHYLNLDTIAVKQLTHVDSFLISASFNLLWLITILTFRKRERYIYVGISCASARVGSLLGVLLAGKELTLFHQYPLGISASVYIILAIFILFNKRLFSVPLGLDEQT